jgi:hypothetical protein
VNAFDPVLNSERVLSGLRLIQTINEVQQAQSKKHMIVVFAVKPDEFEANRIFLFQDYVRVNTGLMLSVIKWRNACIKAFFDIEGIDPVDLKRLSDLFQSPSFGPTAKSLEISHIQLDRIYRPQ